MVSGEHRQSQFWFPLFSLPPPSTFIEIEARGTEIAYEFSLIISPTLLSSHIPLCLPTVPLWLGLSLIVNIYGEVNMGRVNMSSKCLICFTSLNPYNQTLILNMRNQRQREMG